MLLQVVAFTRDVRRDFLAVGQADTGDLTDGRVRLFRRHGRDLGAHATLKPRSTAERGALAVQGVHGELERRALGLDPDGATRLTDELVDGWHAEKR